MATSGEPPVTVLILDAVRRVRPAVVVFVSLATTFLVAIGDIVTGTEIAFSAFYLLPVVLAASGAGARIGLQVAVITALTWFAAELAVQPGVPVLVHLWNLGVRFAVVALVLGLLNTLAASAIHERQLSRLDTLSGLANSRAFFEIADHERRNMARTSEPLTIAYIDIDNFKSINDSLGHSVGDAVIRATARTITESLRESDLIGRLGGDQFAVLLPRTSVDGAEAALAKMHDALNLEASHNGWAIGYSVGSVTFNQAPRSVDDMVRQSDELMYEVKRSGKNAIRVLAAV